MHIATCQSLPCSASPGPTVLAARALARLCRVPSTGRTLRASRTPARNIYLKAALRSGPSCWGFPPFSLTFLKGSQRGAGLSCLPHFSLHLFCPNCSVSDLFELLCELDSPATGNLPLPDLQTTLSAISKSKLGALHLSENDYWYTLPWTKPENCGGFHFQDRPTPLLSLTWFTAHNAMQKYCSRLCFQATLTTAGFVVVSTDVIIHVILWKNRKAGNCLRRQFISLNGWIPPCGRLSSPCMPRATCSGFLGHKAWMHYSPSMLWL